MLKLSLYSELGVTIVHERGVFSKEYVYRNYEDMYSPKTHSPSTNLQHSTTLALQANTENRHTSKLQVGKPRLGLAAGPPHPNRLTLCLLARSAIYILPTLLALIHLLNLLALLNQLPLINVHLLLPLTIFTRPLIHLSHIRQIVLALMIVRNSSCVTLASLFGLLVHVWSTEFLIPRGRTSERDG